MLFGASNIDELRQWLAAAQAGDVNAQQRIYGSSDQARQSGDPWTPYRNNLFGDASNWFNTGAFSQPYGGQLTAGLSPLQEQARTSLTGFLSGDPSQYTRQAFDATSGLLGYQPPTVSAPGAQATSATYGGDVNAPPIAWDPADYAGNISAERINVQAPGYAGNVTAPQAMYPGDVTGGSFLGGPGIGAYMNPYTSGVIDVAMQDIERSRQIANTAGARSADASTYGGDRNALIEAETNRGYADAAARTAAQLRSQGFDTAAGLMGQDLNRGFSAGIANQGAQLGLGQFNAGLGLQAGLANQNAMQRYGEFGANLGLQSGLANQSAGLQAALANQGTLQGLNQFNANLGMQGGLANQSASLQAMLANQAQQQQNSQFNAGQANNMASLLAQLQMQASLANQGAGLDAAQLQLGAANQLGGLGGQLFNQGIAGASALNQFGTQDQMTNQMGMDSAYNEWLRTQYGPMQGYQFLGGLLSGMPLQQPQASPWSGLLGLGLTGAGLLMGGPAGGAVMMPSSWTGGT